MSSVLKPFFKIFAFFLFVLLVAATFESLKEGGLYSEIMLKCCNVMPFGKEILKILVRIGIGDEQINKTIETLDKVYYHPVTYVVNNVYKLSITAVISPLICGLLQGTFNPIPSNQILQYMPSKADYMDDITKSAGYKFKNFLIFTLACPVICSLSGKLINVINELYTSFVIGLTNDEIGDIISTGSQGVIFVVMIAIYIALRLNSGFAISLIAVHLISKYTRDISRVIISECLFFCVSYAAFNFQSLLQGQAVLLSTVIVILLIVQAIITVTHSVIE